MGAGDDMLLTAMGTLSAVVALFWKIINAHHKETKEKGEKLESKLEENQSHLLHITEEMGKLKGRVSLAEEITPKLDAISEGINDLSSSALTAIHKQ